MPAISPFMTSGTITRWKKQEGEAFSVGDVLLQIESDIAIIDVEAESAGVLGKILLPDGSKDVPVEQVIALVVNDRDPTSVIYQAGPTPPPYSPIPSPITRSMASPARTEVFQQLSIPSPARRSPTLADAYHGHHPHRGMTVQHPRQKLAIVPPSPRTAVSLPIIASPVLSAKLHTAPAIPSQHQKHDCSTIDGATIRQIFRSNLSRDPTTSQ
ncbi:hypothetical protein H0H92_011893 [Tricholoma furcatifolium]|nr:hypothetical protein H0H92_011893 [Tricholoma furcatifolium]